MRRVFGLLAAFLLIFPLKAQEIDQSLESLSEEENPLFSGIFPVSLILESQNLFSEEALLPLWRPDWPLELPPDAFKVKQGEITRCTIKTQSFALEYCIYPDGRLMAFPLMLNGRLTQVRVEYDGLQLREIVLTFPSGEDPWKLEVLESRDSFPFILRGSCLDSWYFIYLAKGVNEILESWYDEEGNPLGAFGFSLAEIGSDRKPFTIRDYRDPAMGRSFHYDSRGFVTDISGPEGLFKALYYKEDLPRYWERRPLPEANIIQSPEGNFYLQWDEEDLLLRIRGEDPFLDYRYEYSFDERGNWIERREIRMVRSFDLLVPVPGPVFTRELELRE